MNLPVSIEWTATDIDGGHGGDKGSEQYSPEAVYDTSLVGHLGYDSCHKIEDGHLQTPQPNPTSAHIRSL
jgi:hypothetical protein